MLFTFELRSWILSKHSLLESVIKFLVPASMITFLGGTLICKQGENKQIYLIIYKAKFQQRTTTCVLFASLRMHSGKTAELSYTTHSQTKH